MVLFGGFYINVNALPIVANWIPYISFIRWIFEALCINEFTGLNFSCSNAVSSGSCVQTGKEALANLGFTSDNMQPAVFGASMIFIGLLVLVFLALEFKREKYMNLGYKGKKYRSVTKKSSSSDPPAVVHPASQEEPVQRLEQ